MARERRGALARERDPQHVGRARRLARGEQAADRRFLRGEGAFQRGAPACDPRRLVANLARLRLDSGERAGGLRDGALGVAQRVARFAARAFLAIEVALQLPDALAQRFEVGLPRLPLRAGRREAQREQDEADQALAFPCAATAAMRFSISAWSPR
jgi:hypothetical protein